MLNQLKMLNGEKMRTDEVSNEKKRTVMLLAVWGTNKGDRAIATFIVKKLHENSCIGRIIVSTNAPDVLEKYMPDYVDIVPMSWMEKKGIIDKFYRRYVRYILFPKLVNAVLRNDEKSLFRFTSEKNYQAIQDADYIICTGGHHVTTLLAKEGISSVTYEMGLMALSAKPYILWTQTFGPLDLHVKKNRQYYDKILRNAKGVYIRDDYSEQVVDEKFPDLINKFRSDDSVFGLYSLYENVFVNAKKEEKVGISIYCSRLKTEEALKDYKKCIHDICEYVLSKGLKIEFFPMETDEEELNIIKDIISDYDKEKVEIFNTNVGTIEQMTEMSTCSFYIGHKTHSIIMALTLGIPLVALCYHEKAYDFMRMFELEKYSILDRDYSFNSFIEKFDDLLVNKEFIRKGMLLRTKVISEKVNSDFDTFINNI